jgi:hypothetical protein
VGAWIAALVFAVGVAGGSVIGAGSGSAVRGGPARAVGPVLTAAATPAEIRFHSTVAVSGKLSDPTGAGEVGGVVVALERDQYPYPGYQVVEHATTSSDGSYTFTGLTPDRDARYRVLEISPPGLVSQPVSVVVDTPVATHVATLTHGELTISATLEHSRAFDWNERPARWYVRASGASRSTLVARTLTREVTAGTTEVTATFYPPRGPFTYRMCFTAGGTRGLGPPSAASCEVSGSAVGDPSAAFPAPAAIASAEKFLDGREGRTGFAVVDSHGQLSGVRMHERFYSASLIKAMLLVAYLRRLAAEHRGLGQADRDLLGPMIEISDNDAASAVFAVVGEAGLVRLASAAQMTDFAPSLSWGLSEISAADQARFFADQESLIPPSFVGYARALLSNIDPSQRWGIPAGVAGRFRVFFKGGWLPDMGIVNQAARLEGHGETIALSILTSGGPGMGYGEETLEDTTERLLG